MKPQETGSWVRTSAVVAVAAGIVTIGTMVSNSFVSAPEAPARVEVAEVDRPSYLSELPERTQQALQAGLIEPAAARAPAADTPVRVASVAELTIAAAPEGDTAVAEAAPQPARFQVTTNGLNVRSAPSGNSGKLFVLKQNEAVEVAEAEGSWVRIETASGATGWAYKRYLAPAE